MAALHPATSKDRYISMYLIQVRITDTMPKKKAMASACTYAPRDMSTHDCTSSRGCKRAVPGTPEQGVANNGRWEISQ